MPRPCVYQQLLALHVAGCLCLTDQHPLGHSVFPSLCCSFLSTSPSCWEASISLTLQRRRPYLRGHQAKVTPLDVVTWGLVSTEPSSCCSLPLSCDPALITGSRAFLCEVKRQSWSQKQASSSKGCAGLVWGLLVGCKQSLGIPLLSVLGVDGQHIGVWGRRSLTVLSVRVQVLPILGSSESVGNSDNIPYEQQRTVGL